jgi:hypothetical protein
MMKNFEDFEKVGKENVDAALRSFSALSRHTQAIAAEVAGYSKKTFEDGTAQVEKLLGVKTLDKAIELQSAYAKAAYEGFVSQAAKIGELYADLAKESYKPYESLFAKTAQK